MTGVFFDDPDGLEGDDLIEYGVARYQTRTSAASLVWPIPDHNLVDRIHRVETPTTLVWGEDDGIAPIGYLDRWAAALPNVVNTHTVADAGPPHRLGPAGRGRRPRRRRAVGNQHLRWPTKSTATSSTTSPRGSPPPTNERADRAAHRFDRAEGDV